MEFFEISENWIIALGKTLVHSLWIGLLLLSLLKAVLQFIPGEFSVTRYRISVATLLLYVGSVLLLFVSLYEPDGAGPGVITIPFAKAVAISAAGRLPVEEMRPPIWHLFSICSYIYFAGLMIVVLRSGLSFRNMHVLRRASIRVTGPWLERFIRIKEQIGINLEVGLLSSEQVDAPLLTGLLKPAVIVPVGMFTHLSAGQVETILMHELYHLRRLDFLINLIQLIVEAIFFYNPAVWTLSRMIRTERETCCDDRVVEAAGSPEDYAKALFHLARERHIHSLLAPSAGGSDQHQLFHRIKRILNQSTMKSNIREKLYALMLMAGGAAILFTLTGFSQGFSIVKHNYFKQESVWDPAGPVNLHSGGQLVQAETVPGDAQVPAMVAQPAPLQPPARIALPVKTPVSLAEAIPLDAVEPLPLLPADTIPMPGAEDQELEDMGPEMIEFPEEIDWEQIRKDIDLAKKEALDGIDWEEIKREVESARLEILEEIDWEGIRKEIEKSRIHLDSLMEDFDFSFDYDMDMDLDLEDIRLGIEGAMQELDEIDWEKMEMEIERSLSEIGRIDVEAIRKEVEKALEEMNNHKTEKE